MKHSTKILLIVGLLFLWNFNISIVYAAPKTHCITLKNNSQSPADDCHVKLVHGSGKIKTGNGAPNFGPQAPATPSDSMYWSSALVPVPANGGTAKICIECDPDEIANRDSCWLTAAGVPLTTKTNFASVSIQIPNSNSGLIYFTNPYSSAAIILSSLVVHADNASDPESNGNYNASGNLVPGIPATLTLAPGQTVSYPFSFSNSSGFVSSQFFSALQTSPTDTYENVFVSSQVITVPTLPQWGLIIWGMILLMVSVVYLRRRRIA